MRDVMIAAHHVKQKLSPADREHKVSAAPLDTTSGEYFDLKHQVIEAEMHVLQDLGFCVHVQHPHQLIVFYQKMVGLQDDSELAQLAWNYMNDGLRTNVFVRFPVFTIACACLHLGSIQRKLPMPEWWTLFDASTADVEEIW